MIRYLRNHKEYIAAILLFYFNLDVAVFGSSGLHIQPVMYLIEFIGFLYFLRQPVKNYIKTSTLVLLITLTMVVGAIHLFNSPTYLYKVFAYLLCCQFITKIDFKKLQIGFYRTAIAIAGISLVFYVLINFVHSAGPFIQYYSENGTLYATNFLYTYIVYWPMRNAAFFREPGVFQIYLNIALLFYYNINKGIIIDKYIIILLLAIFTTLSSAGIVMGIAILVFRLLQTKNVGAFQNALVLVFACVAYVGISFMFDAIFYKVMLGTEESGSFFARTYSLIVPMQICMDYPIFGCGANEFTSLLKDYHVAGGRYLTLGLITNSITVNFATSGIFVGIMYLSLFCSGVKNFCYTYKYRILFVVIMLILVSCENITYSLLFNFVLMLGLINTKISVRQ